jgi:hypothetical protein
MDIGTWFEYEVTQERSDDGIIRQFNERYELESKNGEGTLYFNYRENFEEMNPFEGNEKYASGIFDHSRLRKDRTEEYSIITGNILTEVYVSDRCGGSETVWVDVHNVAYKDVRKQMWSMGVIYTETRILFAYSLR